MASIFSFLCNSDPWVNYSFTHTSLTSNLLHSGPLSLRKSGPFVTNNYQLTQSALIEVDFQGLPIKLTRINWKVLAPFYEETSDSKFYGFRLGNDDFYVDSSEILDEWLHYLRQVCINSGFDEDFVVIKEIGTGSTCKVYLIEDIENHKQYAAKCISKQYLSDRKNALANLIHEIQVLSSLDHPSVVPLYFVYETSDCIYLVMEYFPHGDLYKRINQKKKFSEEICIKFAMNLLDVLDYLSSRNIVHRDLKLENIMMTSDNDYDFKIIDFGLSYECTGLRQDKCGSPGYIAPEMLNKACYNSKVDIFSAGVILYILLVGDHPFNARNSEKILEKNKECKYKKINGKVSKNAEEFVTTMMIKDPEKRPEIAEFFDFAWVACKRRGSLCTWNSVTRNGSIIFEL